MDDDRCRNCGAQLAEGAEWCNLCYTPVAESLPEPEPEPAHEAPPSATLPTALPPMELSADAPVQAGDAGSVVDEASGVADPKLVWACPTCGEENPLDLSVCSVCGTPFGKLFEDDPATSIEPEKAQRLGLVPGLALAKLGHEAEGLVRMIAAVLGVVVLLLFATSGGGTARLILVALWLSFVGLIVAESSVSSRRVAEGGRPMIPGRQLMYIFAGVFLVSVIVVVLVGITARGQVS